MTGNYHVGTVVIVVALIVMSTTPTYGGALGKSAGKALAHKIMPARFAVPRRVPTGSARGSLTAAEEAALRKELAKLDAKTLAGIQRRWGRYIEPNKLRAAHASPAKYLSHGKYQKQVTKDLPKLEPGRSKRVVGHYVKPPVNRLYVDRQNPIIVRTTTHERLHQLGSKGYRLRTGEKMTEGTTEFLAARLSRDTNIRGMPVAYSQERRIVEMLAGRVSEKRIAQSYFSGNVLPIKREVDRQLGRGSFDQVLIRLERGEYAAAERILKYGLQ